MDLTLLFPALGSLATSIPVLVVWTMGLVVAVLTRRRHPVRSWLVIVGLLVMMVLRLVGVPLSTVLPALSQQWGWSMSTVGQAFAVIGIVQNLVSAVAWSLLLAAVFVRPEEAT